MKRGTLFVLTKKWGRNYTGATLATQYFVDRWTSQFDRIAVFTLEIGNYDNTKQNISVLKCKNEQELLLAIKEENRCDSSTVGYSDDHLGYLLKKANIPYIHTYHGNWPDARWVNAEFFIKSFYFMPLYKRTIRNAEAVANVSIYMENFTKRYNSKSILIRNGMDFKPCEADSCYPKTYVMVGNIDTRKYKNAIRVAKYIYDIDPKVRIDIYGKAIDKNVAKQLEKLPNVRLMGQHSIIPYGSYCGLINVSEIENLSISVCEAIKSGIPVFCFNIGGLPEVVKKDKTGYTFPKKNYKQMAQNLVDYACDENKMRVDKRVLDPFDWNIAAKKYMTLFEEIMKDTTK